MLSMKYVTQSIKLGALAIAPLLFSPITAWSNPLTMMEGWVYIADSSPAFGVQQHGLPEGLVNQGGLVVGDAFGEPSYLIGLFKYQDQLVISFEQLLMQRKVTRGGAIVNEQFREILDSVIASDSEYFQFTCQLNGQEDPEIMAIANIGSSDKTYVDTEWLTKFKTVWRANLTTKQLEPISSENIRCLNIHYGYDG